MHVATVSVNESLFADPLGDDLAVLRSLAEGVRRLTVVVATRSEHRAISIESNVRVVPVVMRSRPDGVLRLAHRLRELDAANAIDLIQAQEPYFTGLASLLAARGRSSATSVGVFGVDPEDRGVKATTPWHRLAAPLGRRVLARADNVQTDSRVIAERLAKRGLPVRYKPMTPLNLSLFVEAGDRRVHARAGTKVLFVGRLGRQKNLPLLLDGFAAARRHVSDAQLEIVGDGPDRASVERRIEAPDLRGSVHLTGTVAQANLPEVYLGADVLACSSRFEGMPRVFLEAGATGLPIVSTPVAGAVELAREATIGLAGDDPDELGTMLLGALVDAQWRRQAGHGLRSAVARRLADPPAPEQQLAVWREAVGG